MRALMFAVLAGVFMPACVLAANGLELSGSSRLRYEALSGQSRAELNHDISLTSLRTIITATYQHEGLRFGAELYDSRAWGAEAGDGIGTGEINTFELVQAWVGGDVGTARWQAGRFTLNIGSRRLVAADDYRNTTNGYTGLRVDTRTAGWEVTSFYVLPQVRLPDDQPSLFDHEAVADSESLKTVLWGVWGRRANMFDRTHLEIGFIGFEEKDTRARRTRDRNLRTVDVRLIRDPKAGQFDYEVELMHQYGTLSASTAANAAPLKASAWFLHADAGYSFEGPLKARLSLEYDYASGDKAGGTYGRFDTLYGMRRADLAPAGIYAQIGRANIITPAVRFEIAPSPRWDGFITARAMWLDSATDAFSTTGVRDVTGRSGRFAGYQIEGRYRYWIVPSVWRAEVNAAVLIKGRFLKDAPNTTANDDETRYLSVALTRQF